MSSLKSDKETNLSNDDNDDISYSDAGNDNTDLSEIDLLEDDKPHNPNHHHETESTQQQQQQPYTHPPWYAKYNVQNQSLEDQSNCLTDWLLIYLSPLLRLGSTKVLESSDIGAPSAQDRASLAYEKMSQAWMKEQHSVMKRNEARRKVYEEKYGKTVVDGEEEGVGGDSSSSKQRKVKPFVMEDASVANAIFASFGVWKLCFGILCYVVAALIGFVPVLVLEDLVKYFESTGSYKTFVHPWLEVVALGIIPVLQSIVQTRSQVIFQHCAVFVRTAVSTLLYEKSLCVSAAGRACTSTGQVVNMMSNDTTQLQRFIQFAGMILVAPIQIILSLVLIYRQVGSATWVGVGFMVFLAPVNVVVFSIVGKMRRKVLKYSDIRVKMMNEILSGIRVIKYYAWEKPFQKEVSQVRENELRALTNLAYVSAVGFSLILLSAPIIQPILVFLTYINVQDDPLSASKAFTTVALFNIMRFPFAFLPMGLLQYIQSKISLRRLARYLQLPELINYVIPSPPPASLDENNDEGNIKAAQVGSITMENASFSWTNRAAKLKPIDDSADAKKKKKSKSERRHSSGSISSQGSVSSASSSDTKLTEEGSLTDKEVLRNISLTINAGELVAVVGTVGSGKSSFLSAILGEMEPLNDSKVYIPQNKNESDPSNFTSYCAQSPWVVNDTLRGNILFGREFNQKRYDQVVEASALLDDLAILPAGDQTEIGEKGINLSGGQKARVSLARALYSSKTKVLLLDDPLSAVDAHVGEHLFRNAIMGSISKGMTRILVTHHVHFLPKCDKVIILDKGEVKHYGKYSDLVAQGVDFAGAVNFEGEDAHDANNDTQEEKTDAGASEDIVKQDKVEEEKKANLKKKGLQLTSKEERETGAIAGKSYVHYARVGGMLIFLTMFAVQGIGRAAEVLSAFWLSHWAKKSIEALVLNQYQSFNTLYYLRIYAAFGMLGVVGLTVRALLMALHRMRASRKLHDDLTRSILRAPVAFFDVTPTGRVLNRFAADMDKIDLDLTQSIGQGMGTIFSVLGAVGAIIAATKGTFMIIFIPIGYIYYVIQKWFRKTSTELQRCTSIAGSPIFSDFSQVLSGTSTIRAFGEKNRFFLQCQNSFDNFNASFNLVYMCNFWLGLRLDILGGLICAFIGGVAVGTTSSGFIPAGWLGLALSYGIEVTGFLKHGVRMIATIEADMNSVERVLFYSNNIEHEAPDIIPEKDPEPGTWPNNGQISLNECSMRYRDGPLVLKKISLSISGGEKIGVVGRTGSGKSSLMNVLFRVTELETDGGSISIDDVNISEIGTDALRLNLSIIPQDPVMFSNTVRYNLDPFGKTSESELWEVLKKVQLDEVIAALPGGLDEQVSEGGENFSQGQRQLLCIARSLLRKPKVLVMDEATASIDNATDASIQKMIRENFSESTVLTIAHRLNTILDSDRVLVLSDGRVAEFDTPKKLMSKADGIFRSMVDKSKSVREN